MSMTSIKEVSSSLNAMHLDETNEQTEKDMDIDHLPLRKTKEESLDDETDITMSDGERKTYEIYVECCSDDEVEAMEIYLSIMSDVVGGPENAIAVLATNMHDWNCFFVNLTRAELEKLVEIDNERIRGIYPPYKPV